MDYTKGGRYEINCVKEWIEYLADRAYRFQKGRLTKSQFNHSKPKKEAVRDWNKDIQMQVFLPKLAKVQFIIIYANVAHIYYNEGKLVQLFTP